MMNLIKNNLLDKKSLLDITDPWDRKWDFFTCYRVISSKYTGFKNIDNI